MGWVLPGPKLPGLELLRVAAIHSTAPGNPSLHSTRRKAATLSVGGVPPSEQVFTLLSTSHELHSTLLSFLNDACGVPRPSDPEPEPSPLTSTGIRSVPKFPATLTLSAHTIAWLGPDLFHEQSKLRLRAIDTFGSLPQLKPQSFVSPEGNCRVPCAFLDSQSQNVDPSLSADGSVFQQSGADPSTSLLRNFEEFVSSLRLYYCVEERQVRFDAPPPTRPEWMKAAPTAPALSAAHTRDRTISRSFHVCHLRTSHVSARAVALSGSAAAVCQYLVTVYPKTYAKPEARLPSRDTRSLILTSHALCHTGESNVPSGRPPQPELVPS